MLCLSLVSRIDCSDDAIARTSRQRSYKERLQSPVDASLLRPDGDPILHESKDYEDDKGDSDGDEESVGHAVHDEVWYHGDDATLWVL